MSGEDWAPGDLALIVREGPIYCGSGVHTGRLAAKPGFVGKVIKVETTIWESGSNTGKSCGCLKLIFDSGRAHAQRARKLHPFTDAERRAELRDLPVPHPENADA